jgi:hypothetical protein
MGISYMACPFLMQEKKEKSILRYIVGWTLMIIGFFVGIAGYYWGNLLFK